MKKLLSLLTILLLSYVYSYAGLKIEPSIVNLKTNEFGTYENKYVIINNYEETKTVVITKENWKNCPESKNISVEDWLKIEKEQVTLKPGESAEIPYKVTVSKDMSGSVSGMVIFRVPQGSMIDVQMRLPIYVIIAGTEKIDFEIEFVNIFKSEINTNIRSKLILKNNGNVHIKHNELITIFDKKNKEIKSISIPDSYPTYAGAKREFFEELFPQKELKKGKYKAVFKIFALGKEVSKEINFKVKKNGDIVIKK